MTAAAAAAAAPASHSHPAAAAAAVAAGDATEQLAAENVLSRTIKQSGGKYIYIKQWKNGMADSARDAQRMFKKYGHAVAVLLVCRRGGRGGGRGRRLSQLTHSPWF